MKIFRKIKVKRNILYYFGEIAIVVFGIFFAIQLNNLNDIRKSRKEEKESLNRISIDLRYEKRFLDFSLKQLNKNKKYLVNVLNNKDTNNLDSMYFHMASPFTHYKMNSEYVSLKSSGKLNLISDDFLRQKLVYYYESTYAYYENVSNEHRQFINGVVDSYFRKNIPRDTLSILNSEQVKIKLKEDIKFINLINEQIAICKHIDKYVTIKQIDSLLKHIKKSLK